MPEQIKKILDRIVEWWKKFNSKQKVLLLSITAVVILALVILFVVVSKPKMVTIISCENPKQAAEVQSLLDGDQITYEIMSDNLTFQVNEKDEATAVFLLAKNDIASTTYSIDNVTNGGFSTTEADKTKLYQKYLESKFQEHIESLDVVKSATIDINLPPNDGTIISKDEQGTAAITLDLKGNMDSDQAYGLALFVATQLGNDTTEGITIIDKDSNILYSGTDSNSVMGMVSSQLSYQQKVNLLTTEKIKKALVDTKVFSNVEVAPNIVLNFDKIDKVSHEYAYPDGLDAGALYHASEYNSTSQGGVSGTPGTDSNDDTDYMTPDNEFTSNEISDVDYDYDINEYITKLTNDGGGVMIDDSSISVVATKYIVYDEEQLKKAGELDDISFDEFKAAHNEATKVEVDESVIDIVAKATGLSADKISFICYEQPEFIEKESGNRSITDILQIVLAVLIFALLGYVVFRSTRSQKEETPEPELSVESLLESTAEVSDPLENIGYSEKSETRILIEKFVDENPDAAALLLRNWLNEEWE